MSKYPASSITIHYRPWTMNYELWTIQLLVNYYTNIFTKRSRKFFDVAVVFPDSTDDIRNARYERRDTNYNRGWRGWRGFKWRDTNNEMRDTRYDSSPQRPPRPRSNRQFMPEVLVPEVSSMVMSQLVPKVSSMAGLMSLPLGMACATVSCLLSPVFYF